MEKLIQKRSEVAKQLRDMLASAETDNRYLSAEEKTKYDRMVDEIESIDDMIERKKKADTFGELEQLEQRVFEQQPMQKEDKNPEVDEFRAFLRGNLAEYNLRRGESPDTRAMTTATGETGGFVIPETFYNKLSEIAAGNNPIRRLATVVRWGAGDGAFPVVDSFGTAYLVGEGSAVDETNPTFQQKKVSGYQMMYMVKPPMKLIQTASYGIEGKIPMWWGKSTGNKEQSLFAVGNGNTQPIGLAVAASNGAETAANSAITGDDIINWFHSLLPVYRSSASWLFPDATIKMIRKIKTPVDTSGSQQYLWSPGLGGNPDTLQGRPIYAADGFAAFAAGVKAGVFGDISQYQIVEWGAPQMLRDPYTDAAYGRVRFIGWQLIDTALPLAEAVVTCRVAS